LRSKYRPDIDGLRAIAVIAVLAFHAFPTFAESGFVGVDIFFVISGYLISTIIVQALEDGTFTFREFYARRIRRILPALNLILIFTYILGWWVLLAEEFKQLSKHILSSVVFVSNFVLQNDLGYFDNSAESKPLLHLWSLAIEEQFYLLWPFLLWLAWKQKFNLLGVAFSLGLLSLILSVVGTHKYPQATFYFPHTRCWELLFGSALAISFFYKGPTLKLLTAKKYYNSISLLGAGILIFGFWIIRRDFDFPGVWAFFPVVGTTLIIASGPQAWLNRVVLSNRVLVYIGLISFPLYLWHWPLLSFARITAAPNINTRIFLVVLSFVLAGVTHVLLERPIRYGPKNKLTVSVLALVSIFIGAIGYFTFYRNGLELRSANHVLAINNEQLGWKFLVSPGCHEKLGTNSSFCLELGNQSNQKLAILGDSSGNSLAPGLASIYSKQGYGIVNFGAPTCPPIRGLIDSRYWKQNNCLSIIERSYQQVLESKTIDTVVLAIFTRDLNRWGIPGAENASLEEKFSVVAQLLDKQIADLKRHEKKVIVTYDVPLSPKHARDCLERQLPFIKSTKCNVNENQLIERHPNLDLFDGYFKMRKDVCIVRQSEILIKGGKLQFFDEKGILIMRDTHHLTVHGSDLIAQLFLKTGCLTGL